MPSPHLRETLEVAPGGGARTLPDVAVHASPFAGELDWVGMQGIDFPITFDAGDGGLQRCRARLGVFVNLVHPERRGIHMSRLYLLLDAHFGAHAVAARTLESLLRACRHSHAGLSDRARVSVDFELLVRRASLRSGHFGWRAYPVRIEAVLAGDAFVVELETEVAYSSTCPASAALSRQLVQEQFESDFTAQDPVEGARVREWLGSERGIIATPHAQRSVASVRVRLSPDATLDAIGLIDRLEQALGTAVQAAVKREDEQAFALANGRNPMFCEDAVRRLGHTLESAAGIAAFRVRVEHHESLHAHDAVAEVSKGF
ncbi:MAG TPA: GTP cyclohydrolase FolE2 [Rhodanobacteraceae bacterium]|nr:GTP cyclohydrolase FolE2 [Rhodanobacteraceae bacterium]